MRLLKINGIECDIDEKTAIGVTIQAYDIANVGKPLSTFTNSFTLPITANNRKIFGFADSVFSSDKTIYEPLRADYWNNSIKLIDNGVVRVELISDRIGLYLVQKLSLWDNLKLLTWDEFGKEFIQWLQPQSNSNFQELIQTYAESVEGLVLPCYMGNLMKYQQSDGSAYVEDPANVWISYNNINGGHFCIYSKAVFQFIEYKYNVKFLTSGGVFAGNIWDDEFAKRLYTPLRNLTLKFNYSTNEYYFDYNQESVFSPLDSKDKEAKTLYDYVIAFFQLFNILKDDVNDEIRLARWDELRNATVENWSNKLSTTGGTFKPSFANIAQKSNIKFSSVNEEMSPLTGAKTLTSNNKNLEVENDLFQINANVPKFVHGYGGVLPDLSDAKTFETFQFFVTAYESEGELARTTAQIKVAFSDGVTSDYTILYLPLPSIYGINNEYLFFDKVIKYPEFREVNVWLTPYDVHNLQFLKQYYFKKLGGSFFINKISGFNPDKSLVPTKIELLKISDKTPLTPPDTDYYVDGIGDGFVDGQNDLWY